MNRRWPIAIVGLLSVSCFERTGPDVTTGPLRPRSQDMAAVRIVGGGFAAAQQDYALVGPGAPPEFTFATGGATLRLRFADAARTGTVETDGVATRFEWTAPDGRVFRPVRTCALTITDPFLASTAPWLEGQAICEATDGDRTVVVLTVFIVSEP